MEGEEGSEVAGGAFSRGELWVRDLVAEVIVGLRERREDLLGSGGSFCSSSLGLMEEF